VGVVLSLKEVIMSENVYTMTISRMTVDKLGVKLYDRASAVFAELVANSYDADATEVTITAPMGQYLANRHKGVVTDKGHIIEIRDNGAGMTPQEINDFYLKIGAERRLDPKRGDVSKKYKRKVMGRKGVGKLAPFGICKVIEVISSGGNKIKELDKNGKEVQGYRTAHLILDQNKILSDVDEDYNPTVGELDGSIQPNAGTILRLKNFDYRMVPDIDNLARELAQRFGIRGLDWKIELIDTAKSESDEKFKLYVGQFDVPTIPETYIRFDIEKDKKGNPKTPPLYRAYNPDNSIRTDINAGFDYEDRFYGVQGWIAYATKNYKDDLVAGVRIYCRGKITAQTSIFNLKSGFTGEYDVRSYIVGEIHADWLDEKDDLIQTDRRDILWSHELGQAFEIWGQELVKIVGKAARNPMKIKVWDVFKETTNVENTIAQTFPSEDQHGIREKALEFVKLIGKNMREEEARDPEQAESVLQLAMTLAPHVTLDAKLREAADKSVSPLTAVIDILKTAHIAELSSYGRIADHRIKVITHIEELKDAPDTLEAAFQDLIEKAPWLINPQWSPISANQSFSTLKLEFQKYYKKKTGEDISFDDFSDPTKRPDFVLSTQEGFIQLIEIKRPHHKLENKEVDRINNYVEVMAQFLGDEKNAPIVKAFKDFHITLVCDEQNISGVHLKAFESLKKEGRLTHIGWASFLAETRKMHEEFLNEADRQRKLASS
jgi:hypothetical protein